jgi:PPM family protein phosphatase
MDAPADPYVVQSAFELAMLSDVGTDRPDNEDAYGQCVENPESVLFAIADGVGGYEGGEIASSMAVEVTLQAYCESPSSGGAAKRLQRAVQRANIEIYNRAIVVPELRRMGTTLTAVVVEDGMLAASHVGDCRLYLVRRGRIRQITKDHTMVAERVRLGLLSPERARLHPERSALSRCLGHELIVSVDRISMPLEQDDRLVLCSDGLYNVLEDRELEQLTREVDAERACRTLVETANLRGTADNLTVAVFRMRAEVPVRSASRSWHGRLFGLFGRGRRSSE